MRTRIPPVLGVFLALTAGAVQAQADRGFFATAQLGRSDTDFHPSAFARIDDSESSYEIGIGYRFNEHLAIRAGWQDFGEVTGFVQCPEDGCLVDEDDGCPFGDMCFAFVQPVPVGVDISGWSARVTGSLPFAGRFAGFASIGVVAWDTSASTVVTLPGVGAVDDLDDSGEGLLYDAGLRWDVSDRWSLEAAYERVNLDIDSFKLGVVFRL